MINVTIFNENKHEKEIPLVTEIYKGGIHGYLKSFLESDDIKVTTVTQDMENCGLTDELLDNTDVIIWWGHVMHEQVPDEVVDKVCSRVLEGMGAIFLHSAHKSKPFMKLMGTTCNLDWRDNDKEILHCVNPSHPIAKGVPDKIFLPKEEMYGEIFDIPQPDELIYIGWFSGGDVFRSGCAYNRGYGKVFYFQPGHETNASFTNENIQKIIRNAVYWAKSDKSTYRSQCRHAQTPVIEEFEKGDK